MPPDALTRRSGRKHGAVLALSAFGVALAARLALIAATPTPFAFDAFQRWAGREHVLVRDWLPATQVVIDLVAALGGSHDTARDALAVIAALGVAAGTAAARRMGGQASGWLFLPMGLFGPYLCWSAALYQEGTFLAVLLGGLALALRARDGEGPWWSADMLVGLLGLVRYEGWPVVALYLLWRGRPAAMLALWGPLAWLAIKLAGARGMAPSPIDYADWDGLPQRFHLATYGASAGRLLGQAWASGGLILAMLGLVGLVLAVRRRAPAAGFVGLVLLAQVAAIAGWMAGLETAIVRMQVVPGVLLGLLAAVGLGPLLARRSLQRAAALCVLPVAAFWTHDGLRLARRSAHGFRAERALALQVETAHLDGPWLLSPRTGLGTRDRHDGCEILQGITGWRHGREFWCDKWPLPDGVAKVPDHFAAHATWARGSYHLNRTP